MKNKSVFVTVFAVVYLLVTAVFAALYIVLDGVPLKAAASAVFLLFSAAIVLAAHKLKFNGYGAYKFLVLAAAALCFAGDCSIDANFIAGMALFGAGHILYISAFSALNGVGWRTVLPAAAVGVFGVLWLLLYPEYNFGAILPAVIAYVVIISVMLGRAAGAALDGTLPVRLRACVISGAVLFFISDFFLTLNTFAGGGDVYRGLCLATYYAAQYLLTLSALTAAVSGGRRIKPQMNVFSRLYCRAFQAAFRLVIPLLPYRQPTPLSGSAEVALLLKQNGKRRALIVTDKNIYALGLCEPIKAALAAEGVEASVYFGTVANPTTSNCADAAKLYREDGCDCIIAVGGGSAMDCAKGAGLLIIKPNRTLKSMRGVLKVFGRLPLFIAVPTTAGTGSETTIAAVITEDETRDKFTIISFCLAPHYAMLDPEMTVGLPPHITSTTGMDALTHAVEAYIGRSTTRFTRKMAVEAVSIIRTNLPAAYADGHNREARRQMQYAAYCAGIAFTISYVGYVHAVAHLLGGKYNTPHGLANAVILPYVLREYGPACTKKLARLARKSGVAQADLGDSEAAEQFIRFVEELNKSMNIPKKLKVDEADIPALAAHADKEANPLYPVPALMDAKALRKIYYLIKE